MECNMIVERDKQSIWHPYTQMGNSHDPLVIDKGKGAYLFTQDGRRLIDAVSSWWVNLHGHSHPYINAKLKMQLDKFEQAMFTDFTHAPAVELAEKLIAISPGNMARVFFSENGSTAVESGIKMALQFWYNLDPQTPRKRVICFKNGYHGDTFGAMSVSGRTHYNKPYWDHLFCTSSIDPPQNGNEEASFAQMETILKMNDTACFIYEPLIQGPGGMRTYSRRGLQQLLELCEAYGIISIADEVMTGFGRTGHLFASDVLSSKPSIICLSKGITGGYLPLGATLCRENIFDAFLSKEASKAFLHGHSYCGNPLACTAAAASIDLLLGEQCADQRRVIEAKHREFAAQLEGNPLLKRCEVLGTILILEYAESKEPSYFSSLGPILKSHFIKRNIIVRPLGNVLYLILPYCISEDDLEEIYACIMETLEKPLC